MAAMSGGEFLGPIAGESMQVTCGSRVGIAWIWQQGGALVESYGFRASSGFFAGGLAPGAPLSLGAFFGLQARLHEFPSLSLVPALLTQSRTLSQPLLRERQVSYTEEGQLGTWAPGRLAEQVLSSWGST